MVQSSRRNYTLDGVQLDYSYYALRTPKTSQQNVRYFCISIL